MKMSKATWTNTNNNILNESRHRNIGITESEEYDDEYQVGKCDGT